jgi:hypothetical protein
MLILLLGVTRISAQQPTQTPTTAPKTPVLSTIQDSLELHLLDLDIDRTRETLLQNNLSHRLVPRISLSASIGAKDLVFVDPSTSQPFVLPQDAYRLTLSFSLTDLLDGSKHTQTALQLERLQCMRAILNLRQEKARQLLVRRLWENEKEIGMALEEHRTTEKIVNYRQLLFDQGKIHFDVLMRSKLDLINATRALERVALQRFELQLEPGTSAVVSDKPHLPSQSPSSDDE